MVLTKNADVGDIVTPLGASSTSKAAVVTLPDMSAKVSFLSRELKSEELQARLAVSQSALIRVKEKNIVYLLSDNKVRETDVTIGSQLGDLQEVTAGLKPGDRVVLKPKGLKDGAKIKVAER